MTDKPTNADAQETKEDLEMPGVTPAKLAFSVLNTKPKRDDEWDYLRKAKATKQSA